MQRYSDDGVRQERSGWRDNELNDRHRLWGYNSPAVDVDALFAEFTRFEPVALVEYKIAGAKPLTKAAREVLLHLANDRFKPLPLLIVHYQKEPWAFRVEPLNEAARQHFASQERLTEKEWVIRWHEIRGETPTVEMLAALDSTFGIRLP